MQRPDLDDAIARTRQLRRSSTPAETMLWNALRSRKLNGAKFRRQVWIAGYIADFLCAEARLVVGDRWWAA